MRDALASLPEGGVSDLAGYGQESEPTKIRRRTRPPPLAGDALGIGSDLASPAPGGTGASPAPGGTGASPAPGGTGASPAPGGTGASPAPGGTGPPASLTGWRPSPLRGGGQLRRPVRDATLTGPTLRANLGSRLARLVRSHSKGPSRVPSTP